MHTVINATIKCANDKADKRFSVSLAFKAISYLLGNEDLASKMLTFWLIKIGYLPSDSNMSPIS